MVGMMAAAQVSAAREADDYVTRILTELDYGPPISESTLTPPRFAGIDGSGLPLDTLFAQSLIELDRQLDREAADMLAALLTGRSRRKPPGSPRGRHRPLRCRWSGC